MSPFTLFTRSGSAGGVGLQAVLSWNGGSFWPECVTDRGAQESWAGLHT